MNLVKRKNDFMFPSVFDDFFTPNWLGGAGSNAPAVNIKDTDKSFYIELAVPGKKKEDFSINLEDDILAISSEDKKEHEEKDKEGRYTRREFSYSSFKRVFTLPETVNAQDINATYKEGILCIELPKKDKINSEFKKRSIQIS